MSTWLAYFPDLGELFGHSKRRNCISLNYITKNWPNASLLVININWNNDTNHPLNALNPITLLVKIQTMTIKRNGDKPLPTEAPAVQPQPEVKPPVEPTPPPTPAEAPYAQPEERPQEISPYDLPPPGDGFFPEIFE
ncbi:hypothetical protein ACFGVS_15200 [Mucilaginibacter sp. AW1-7]|uniref:hypothetical protein n=1 Tax=Mucilaginibacter sp. AW1-7 TaxID=3349874 RepID=UPI003F738352